MTFKIVLEYDRKIASVFQALMAQRTSLFVLPKLLEIWENILRIVDFKTSRSCFILHLLWTPEDDQKDVRLKTFCIWDLSAFNTHNKALRHRQTRPEWRSGNKERGNASESYLVAFIRDRRREESATSASVYLIFWSVSYLLFYSGSDWTHLNSYIRCVLYLKRSFCSVFFCFAFNRQRKGELLCIFSIWIFLRSF